MIKITEKVGNKYELIEHELEEYYCLISIALIF